MTYLEKLAESTKEPIYYIIIFDTNGTSVLQQYETHPILGLGGTRGPGLLPPKTNLQKVNEAKGTITIGKMSFEVLDVEQDPVDNTIIELVNTNSLTGNKVEFYGGFYPLLLHEFERLFTGEIVSVKVNSSATGIVLDVYDLTNALNREVLTFNKDNTALTNSMGPGTTILADVEDVSSWPESGYVRIEEEIIKYYTRTDIRLWLFTGDGKITGRGIYNTWRGVPHLEGTPVWRVSVFEVHPVNMVLSLLTTTEDGNNGPYDLGIADFGLGISQFDVDIDSFEWVRGAIGEDEKIRLLIDAEETIENPWTAEEVVNEWILRPIGCYMVIEWNGKIALRMISSQFFPLGPNPFVDRNLIGNLSFERNAKNVYNNTTYIFNHHPGTNEMVTLSGINLPGGLEVYGKDTPLAKYETRAYHSDFDAGRLFYAHLKRRYEHSINPMALIRAKSTFSQLSVSLGEVVSLNTNRLPAVQTDEGGWGILGDVQVTNKQPNYSIGTIDWRFQFLDDVKELAKSESYVIRTPDDGVVTFGLANSSPVVEPEDGYYENTLGDSSNHVMIQLQFSTGTDTYAREVFLNMTLWVLSGADDNYIRYDFSLRYIPDGTLHTFRKWFIVPYGVYKYKVDYWDRSVTEGFGSILAPWDITWFTIRLYKLDYVAS